MSLTDSRIYKKNIEILKERYPEFSKDIIEKYPRTSLYSISEARDGRLTAKINNIWVHSSMAPEKEAEKLVRSEIKQDSGLCIVMGFGLGYHIEYLHNNYKNIDILIIEKEPSLFLEALNYRDFRKLLSSESAGFLFDIKTSAVTSILTKYKTANIQRLRLRAIYERSAEYYQAVDEAVSSFLSRKETNANTLNRFGRTWIKNLFRNIEVFRTAYDAGVVFGRFNKFPAIVIAAGPSLDELLPFIPDIHKRFVIICVDTALRAVLQTGITPDFIVVVDPQYLNTRHLDNLLVFDKKSRQPFLVSESSTHPAVFRKTNLPVLFFKSVFPLGQLFERTAGIISELGAGGSVATTAWDLARKLGCSRIYSAGLDLGYSDNRTHCRNSLSSMYTSFKSDRLTTFDTVNFNGIHNAGAYPENNNSGGQTLTDKRLIIYKWWFEGQLENDPLNNHYFNLSKSGIKIKGMEFYGINELLMNPECRKEIDELTGKLAAQTKKNTDRKKPLSDILQSISEECRNLEGICFEALMILDMLETTPPGTENYRKELEKLTELDQQISNSPTRELSEFIIQPVLNEILADKADAEDTSEEPASSLDSSRRLYMSIGEACSFHRKHAEIALRRQGRQDG